MNCANHADASAVAYCRTCGKALCANCTRPVRGVIFCEDCLGSKMEGVPAGISAGTSAGTAGFVPGAAPAMPGAPGVVPAGMGSSGPNPALAGILAIFPAWARYTTGNMPRGWHIGHLRFAGDRGECRGQRALHGSRRFLRLGMRSLSSIRFSMRCARRRRSRWRSRLRTRLGWRRLLEAARR